MLNPCLDRPRTKVRYVLSVANRDGPILVPHDFPIGIGGLVKQDAAHRKRFFAEKTVDQCLECFRCGEFAHHRDAQQVSLSVFVIAKVSTKIIYHLFREATGNDCKALLFNTL